MGRGSGGGGVGGYICLANIVNLGSSLAENTRGKGLNSLSTIIVMTSLHSSSVVCLALVFKSSIWSFLGIR